MELIRDGVMRWQEICMQLVLGMGGFDYVRFVNCGQSCVPVLLTFLHKTEEQSLVLLLIFKFGIISVCLWSYFPKEV